jgi:hypothetical protein
MKHAHASTGGTLLPQNTAEYVRSGHTLSRKLCFKNILYSFNFTERAWMMQRRLQVRNVSKHGDINASTLVLMMLLTQQTFTSEMNPKWLLLEEVLHEIDTDSLSSEGN